MSRGMKRPRKSTALSAAANAAPAAASGSGSGTDATPSVGPKDIVPTNKSTLQLQQEDAASKGMAYSSTPPSIPTKKLSKGNIHSSGGGSSSIAGKQQDGESTSPPTTFPKQKPTTAAAPVKSALAASARLAAGPPGSLSFSSSGSGSTTTTAGNERYKRRMYIAYVDNAFAERERGQSKSYWDLTSQFRSSALTSNGPSGVQSLSLWLLALSHHVTKLDAKTHSQLVENILDLPWAGAGDDFARSWCRFVCALVSARVEWATSVLDRIVKAFRWRSNWLPLQPINMAAASSSASSTSLNTQGAAPPTRRVLYTRCHLLLRALLTLIPTLPSSLNPLLVRHFPHKREGKREQSTYARNVLFITQYESQVSETVWRLVIDRAIGLDVEIQIELDDLDNEGDEGDDDSDSSSGVDPFDLVIDDEDSDVSDDDDEDEDGDDADVGLDDISDDEGAASTDDEAAAGIRARSLSQAEIEQREKKVRDLVGKLDGLLKVCFEHLDHIGKGKGRQSSELVLDTRPTWLSEFLGSGGIASRGGSSTPTLERSQSSATLKEKSSKSGMGQEADNEDANSDDSYGLPPPSGIAKTRSSPPVTASRTSEADDEALQASKDALFHQLLNLFSRSILPTFKCRHVQFLLFWYCSLDNDFADFFLGFLIHKAIYAGSANEDGAGGVGGGFPHDDRSAGNGGRARGEPIVLRQASASYVASFVSRAKYITPSYTRTVVLNLCSYLEAHLEAYSNAVTFVNSVSGLNSIDEKTQRLALAPPGSEEHAIFYAVAQAVFYIFCFRWQDLQHRDMQDAAGMLHGMQAGRKGQDAAGVDFEDHEHDSGFMIGSLSSTGSSSYALPSSFHRVDSRSGGAGGDLDDEEDCRRNGPAINVEFPEDAGSGAGAGAGGHSEWSAGLSVLQRAILSPLNPLQYCSPTVVNQFATVAQHVGFLYCWSVIEANKRGGGGGGVGGYGSMESASTTASSTQQQSSRQSRQQHPTTTSSGPTRGMPGNGAALTKDLEGFFPFDPYRLNSTSDSFIKPMYREWSDVAPAGMMDDSDSSEGESSDNGDDSDSDFDDDDGSSTSSEAAAVQRTGLQIPGADKRSRHRRRAHGADAGLLSPSDASQQSTNTSSSTHRHGRGQDDAAFAKSLEAMSMSAG